MTYTAYTDGACSNNGRSNPQGAIGIHSSRGDVSEALPTSMGRHTNNMAEHAAINRAIRDAPREVPVVIKTDSELAKNTYGGWAHKWQDNGGRTASGSTPANWGLVQDTQRQIDQRRSQGQSVQVEHVRGHSNNSGNNRAHDLAQRGLSQGQGGGSNGGGRNGGGGGGGYRRY